MAIRLSVPEKARIPTAGVSTGLGMTKQKPYSLAKNSGGQMTAGVEVLCCLGTNHTTPWAIMAWASFRKPATLAPSIRSPGLPHSTEAS